MDALQPDPDELRALCVYPMPFGRYKGLPLIDLPGLARSYRALRIVESISGPPSMPAANSA